MDEGLSLVSRLSHFSDIDNKLRGETAAATATLDGIGVLEGEAALVETFVEVDRCPIEVQAAPLVDGDLDPVLFNDQILGFIDLLIEPEAVLETAATSADDSDAKQSSLRHFLIGNHAFDFAHRSFSQLDSHVRLISSKFCCSILSMRQKSSVTHYRAVFDEIRNAFCWLNPVYSYLARIIG